MQPLSVRRLFDDQSSRYHGIRRRKGVAVTQVYLLLRRSRFVMRILDRNAHLLKRQNRIATKIGRIIKRRQVEIASPVDRIG